MATDIDYTKMFDKVWFERHQRILLFLCNAPILKYWFRYVLRISHDLGWREQIVELRPNNYKIALGHNWVRTDFRTHRKFSKRIYFAFRLLWWMLHYWDAAIEFFFLRVHGLSFGYSTLTTYPDPDPETTTVDGLVTAQVTNTSWADLRVHAGTSYVDNDWFEFVYFLTDILNDNKFQALGRVICLFDTSDLTAGASHLSAVLSWCAGSSTVTKYCDGPASWSANAGVNVYSSNPTSNTALDNNDFSTLGTTPFSTACSYTDWPGTLGVYHDFTLNAAGIAAINKTGVTKYGFRESYFDAAGNTPEWTDHFKQLQICGYMADRTGTAEDPKLVVSYLAPGELVCWGAELATEFPISWDDWEVSAGVPITVDGDADWGAAIVAGSTPIYGTVIDTGSSAKRTFTVTKDKYDTGSGSVTIYIRPASSSADRVYDDTDITWVEYTGPTELTTQYVQLMAKLVVA